MSGSRGPRMPWAPDDPNEPPPTNREFGIALASLVGMALVLTINGLFGHLWLPDEGARQAAGTALLAAGFVVALIMGPVVRRRIRPPR